jgi:hypothetical protein
MKRLLTALGIVAAFGSCEPICACVYPTYAHIVYGEAPFAGTDSAWQRVEADVGAPPCGAFAPTRTSGADVAANGTYSLMAISTESAGDWCVRVRFIESHSPSADSLVLTPFLATFSLEREDSTHVVLPP